MVRVAAERADGQAPLYRRDRGQATTTATRARRGPGGGHRRQPQFPRRLVDGRRPARRNGRLSDVLARGPGPGRVRRHSPQHPHGPELPHVGRLHLPGARARRRTRRWHPKDVAVYDFVMGKKVSGDHRRGRARCPEDLGPIPTSWPRSRPACGPRPNKYALERGYEMPRAWIMGYDEERDQRYGYGMVIDWWLPAVRRLCHLRRSCGTRPRTSPTSRRSSGRRRPPARPRDPAARTWQERALLKYQDVKIRRQALRRLEALQASRTGRGRDRRLDSEISRQRPGRASPLRDVCEKHWKFELFRAGLLPQVVIASQAPRPKSWPPSDEGQDQKATASKSAAVIENTGAAGHADGPRRPAQRQPRGRRLADRRPRQGQDPAGRRCTRSWASWKAR